jgi:cytoskeletal protein RodZ
MPAMASDRSRGELQIGEVLKEARGRAGLEISAVEEQTKIRTRYLRALENEQWEVLPGHAYAKGFLRTYAILLGLDAEALLDEYRRRVEHARPGQLGPAEPWTAARVAPGEPGGRHWATRPGVVVAALVAIVLAVLLALGLTGGNGDAPEPDVAAPIDRIGFPPNR